jgi:hypothetical protein
VFADDFLPVYDVSDEVAIVVAADPKTVWDALLEADLLEVGKRVPLAGVLGALRMLPELVSHLLHGERPPQAPESMRLRDLAKPSPDTAVGSCSASGRTRRSPSAWSASSGDR